MPDWDAVIIGGGPAGLTAGLYLCRGGWRSLLIEKETVGGYIRNVEFIENYPGFNQGVVGSQLAMEMKNQALKYGLEIQRGEITGLQGSPGRQYVICTDGTAYATAAVIIAGAGHGSGADQTLQYVRTESRLRDTDARKNDRIYSIDANLASRPGPRIVDALEKFAQFIHPELFEAPGVS